MKKLILSALFLAFAGILAACGSSNNASDNKTITVAASKHHMPRFLKKQNHF